MSAPVQAAGIPWYSREDYPRILEIMEDAHLLPRSFDEWLKAAQAAKKRLLAQGILVVEAKIEPDAFVTWCRANGHHVDAKGRMAFGNLIAYQYAMKNQ